LAAESIAITRASNGRSMDATGRCTHSDRIHRGSPSYSDEVIIRTTAAFSHNSVATESRSPSYLTVSNQPTNSSISPSVSWAGNSMTGRNLLRIGAYVSISSKSVPPQFGHESQFTGVGSASLTACRTNPQPWHSLKMSKQEQLWNQLPSLFHPSNLVEEKENSVTFASAHNESTFQISAQYRLKKLCCYLLPLLYVEEKSLYSEVILWLRERERERDAGITHTIERRCCEVHRGDDVHSRLHGVCVVRASLGAHTRRRRRCPVDSYRRPVQSRCAPARFGRCNLDVSPNPRRRVWPLVEKSRYPGYSFSRSRAAYRSIPFQVNPWCCRVSFSCSY
jgi:hypothetical protein